MNKRIPMFYGMTVLFWFSLYAYVPIISAYAKSLEASTWMIGLIAGAYGFTQMLARVPLGIVSDVLKKRKIFISIGVGFAILSGAGVFVFQNVGAILFFRACSGIAAAAWVVFTILFSSYFRPDESVKAIGYLQSANALGTIAALLLGGLVANRFGMPSAFLLAAGAGVVALVLSFGVVENREIVKEPIRLRDIFEVAKDRRLLVFSLIAVISQYIAFATTFGFTPLVAENLGANKFELGVLSTIASLPALFIAPLSGTLFLQKFGAKNTMVGGFVLVAFACFVIPYCPNLMLLYLSQFLGGIGGSAVFSLTMGLSIQTITESKRATAMGFFQAIYGLGMFIGPTLSGIIGDAWGLNAAFFAAGFVGIAGIVFAWFLVEAKRLG